MPAESLTGRVEQAIALMRIGHALAGHKPDIPGLLWTDPRLMDPDIDNTARFMDAAHHLFRKFALFKNPQLTDQQLQQEAGSLVADLGSDIGPSATTKNALSPRPMAARPFPTIRKENGQTLLSSNRDPTWPNASGSILRRTPERPATYSISVRAFPAPGETRPRERGRIGISFSKPSNLIWTSAGIYCPRVYRICSHNFPCSTADDFREGASR
jgi:hypothetical protein